MGDGTYTNRNTPVQVSSLSGITSIAGGASYSLFLKNDGTVWAVGLNYYGELGDSTNTDRTIPVKVNSLNGIIAIAAGNDYSLFLKNDGSVWAVGFNDYGQLGDGTTTDKNVPIQVSSLSGISAIAAGVQHSLFLKNDGSVWAAGWNIFGQLGDGTTTDHNTPVQVTCPCGNRISILNEIACNSYTLNDTIYISSGTYIQTITNASGCDSVITLILIVNTDSKISIDTTINSGQIYTVGSHTYTDSGTYIDTFTAANGCDSIITTNLTVLTGIESIVQGKIPVKIFSNPTEENFTLELNSEIKNCEIKIFNLLGENMLIQKLDNKKEIISCKKFPSGIYFYKISNEKKEVIGNGKLVIE